MMTDRVAETAGTRRAVSVVMPFAGTLEEARDAAEALRSLRVQPGDELILADNTPTDVAESVGGNGVRVVRCPDERSSYYARNIGAEHAAGEWLLFLDADCRPSPRLLEDYFAEPVAADVGLLAGGIRPAREQPGLVPRWAASREILSQERSMQFDPPAAATANVLVRRAAWQSVGGFLEGVRSGEDFEFCWRLRDAGWSLNPAFRASVQHIHRESLRGVARQMARYSAGNEWQARRWAARARRGQFSRPLARAIVATPALALTLRFERAAMKLVDLVALLAQALGGLGGNAAPRPSLSPDANRRLVVATDRFPVATETFVVNELEALRKRGWRVRVEAMARPSRPLPGAGRGLRVDYVEDEGPLDRLRALSWVAGRHPIRAAKDLLGRSDWPAEERLSLAAIAPQARRLALGRDQHVHVHFAALSSVNALRAGRLAGVPVSIAAHGHEIFRTPRGLSEKLQRAAFVAAPCEYTAQHLRPHLEPAERDRVRTIVMGVNGQEFRRSDPYPDGGVIVAVGRLVEKKGFGDLIGAAAILLADGVINEVRIAGDGPLRGELQERADSLGIGDRVELLGVVDPRTVREVLEGADALVMPSVVAPDGDRDAMPVVVKEALAMGVPVVATNEVGLPEVVDDRWGRLVPPADPPALAEGIASLMRLPARERAAMGEAGRDFVLRNCDVDTEAARLEAMIDRTVRPRRPGN